MLNGTEIWRFRFFNIKLWEIPTQQLRDLSSIGVLPLLPLTRGGSRPEVVEEVLQGIDQYAPNQESRKNLLTIALTLATLALKEPAHRDWIRKRFTMYQDLIRDTEIYQMIVAEGLQQGMQQGMQQGLEKGAEQKQQEEAQKLRQTLLEVFQIRFPELLALARKRIGPLTDLDTLNQLVRAMMLLESRDQARSVLEIAADSDRPSEI